MALGVQPLSCGRMGKGGWIIDRDVKPGAGAEDGLLLGVEGLDVAAGRGMTVLVMLTWPMSTGAIRSVLFVVLFGEAVEWSKRPPDAVGWRKRLPDAVGVSASVPLVNGYGEWIWWCRGC